MLKLEKASPKAIKLSCLAYHYAKRLPAGGFGYSVFENDIFCGVILFGNGANNNIGKQYGLVKGEICELTRVALNGKQTKTSKCLAVALKLLKKDNPLIKMVVSYADKNQGHKGTIYQATNWLYTGEIYCEIGIKEPHTKEIVHSRTMSSRYGTLKGLERIYGEGKHKYIYVFDKRLNDRIKVKEYTK